MAILSLIDVVQNSVNTLPTLLHLSRPNGKSVVSSVLMNPSLFRSNPVSQETLIRQLVTTISKAMQQNGMSSFFLSYTGSSDSTDGYQVQVIPQEKDVLKSHIQVDYTVEISFWDSTDKTIKYKQQNRTSSLEDAAYELAEMLWEYAGQGGWYNDEGGGGYLTIYPNATYEFEHYNNVTVEEKACHWLANALVGPLNADYEGQEELTKAEGTPP